MRAVQETSSRANGCFGLRYIACRTQSLARSIKDRGGRQPTQTFQWLKIGAARSHARNARKIQLQSMLNLAVRPSSRRFRWAKQCDDRFAIGSSLRSLHEIALH